MSRVLKKSSGIDCPARTIKEETLQAAVVTAINDAWLNKDEILPKLRENIRSVLEKETENQKAEVEAALKMKQEELLNENLDQEEAAEIEEAIIKLSEERQSILMKAAMQKDVRDRIEDLAVYLNEQIEGVPEYSETLVRRMIERITVFDEILVVKFKSGLEIEVEK